MPVTDVGDIPDPKGPEPKKKAWVTDGTLFELASEFYAEMDSTAKWIGAYKVWEGSLSKWFIDGGKRHLYSPVMRLLYAAGCCNIVSRGGGPKPSVVQLHHAPTLAEVKNLRENEFFFEKESLTGKAKAKILEQMVNNHRQQIAVLTERVERLERQSADHDN